MLRPWCIGIRLVPWFIRLGYPVPRGLCFLRPSCPVPHPLPFWSSPGSLMPRIGLGTCCGLYNITEVRPPNPEPPTAIVILIKNYRPALTVATLAARACLEG